MARKQAGAHAKSPVELCFAARVRDTCMRTCVGICQCTPGDVHMRVLQQHGARLGHRLGGGENVVALESKQCGAHTRADRPGTAAAPPHASTHMHDDSHHDCCMSSRSCQVITIHTDVRPSVLYPAMPDGAVRKLPRTCSSADTPPLVLSSGHLGHSHCEQSAARARPRVMQVFRKARHCAHGVVSHAAQCGAAGAQDLVANP
jgi:hypothetical protein